MNVEIDKITPCLEKTSTGEIVRTGYSAASTAELASLKGWLFNWTDPSLNDSTIYKLTVDGDSRIHGLIALRDEPNNSALYAKIAENAPHNKGKDREYYGVGAHLFAVAAIISVQKGYGGFIYMDAKNMRLVEHYIELLGASLVGGVHPYRLSLNEPAAKELIRLHSLEVQK